MLFTYLKNEKEKGEEKKIDRKVPKKIIDYRILKIEHYLLIFFISLPFLIHFYQYSEYIKYVIIIIKYLTLIHYK